MKKLTTKLLMSIIAVAFAFVALGTSTYAWFSMNTSVTASGMSITAKADQTFLVIANSNASLAVTDTTATANTATAQIYPAKFKELGQSGPTWQTAYSADPNSADKKTGTDYADIADATNYVLHNTFYIKVANGAVSASNLKLSGISVDKDNQVTSVFEGAVSVLVVVGETAVNCIDGTLPTGENNPTLAETVTDSTFIAVDVYIYFNGDNANVKTINADATNLVAIPVQLTFSVDGMAN